MYLSSLALLFPIFTKISVSSPTFNSVTNPGLISSCKKVIFWFRPWIAKLGESICCRMLQEAVGQKVRICVQMLSVPFHEFKDKSSSAGPSLMDVPVCQGSQTCLVAEAVGEMCSEFGLHCLGLSLISGSDAFQHSQKTWGSQGLNWE